MSFPLEDERAFLETLGETGVQTDGRAFQGCQVVFHPCAHQAHSGPVQVRIAVGRLENAGVDAPDSGNGLFVCPVRAFRRVGHGYAYGKSAPFPGCVWKHEIVFPVLLHAVRRPHGIAVRLAPGDVFLAEDDTVVRPVDEVFRRKDVIVGHAEPLPFRLYRADDVMRCEKPDLIAENTGGGIGRILIPDDGILGGKAGRDQNGRQQQQKDRLLHDRLSQNVTACS